MLVALNVALVAFSPAAAPAACTRRAALGLGAVVATGCAAPPAFAEYMGMPPPKRTVSAAEYAEQVKEYKTAPPKYAPGQGSEAFKAAEIKRAEAAARLAKGEKFKEESAADQIARLGLKTYGG